MRKIVAICLLLIYSVCSTGASIHMHHCGKSTLFSVLQDARVSHESCPMCLDINQDHENQNVQSSDSHCEDNNTCTDSRVDLELSSESDQSRAKIMFGNIFDFSPSIVLIPWIINTWEQIIGDQPHPPTPFKPALLAENHSVYLINCTLII